MLQILRLTTSRQQESRSETIPLPDIKEARKRKQMEEELARMEQEKEAQKVKIKRSDKEAFAKASAVFCFTMIRLWERWDDDRKSLIVKTLSHMSSFAAATGTTTLCGRRRIVL